MNDGKKLYRNTDNKVIAGVCSGLADYFNMDVTLVRVLFAASILFSGIGVVGYVVGMLVIPEKPATPAPKEKVEK